MTSNFTIVPAARRGPRRCGCCRGCAGSGAARCGTGSTSPGSDGCDRTATCGSACELDARRSRAGIFSIWQNCSTKVLRKSTSLKRLAVRAVAAGSASARRCTMRSRRWLLSWMMVSRRCCGVVDRGLFLQQLGGVADRADSGLRISCAMLAVSRPERRELHLPRLRPACASGPRGRSPRPRCGCAPTGHEARAHALV